MLRNALLIAAAFVCLLGQPATAQIDYDKDPVYQAARTAMMEGRYAEAFPEIKRAAEAGFAKAQFNLAMLYRDGPTATASQELYRKWIEASAAQEFSMALFSLGLDYDVGRGVTKDLPRALGYYERAAEAGDTMAAYNAGQIHLMGEGVIPPNHVKAIRYIELSAKANEGKALMTLGYIYETGLTGLQDVNLSRDYYYRAEVAGEPAAAEAIDRLKEVASRAAFDKMLAGDHSGAVALFGKLCDEADMEACAYYGNYLANGAPGVSVSVAEALPPLKKACDAGEMYGCQFQAFAVAKAKFGADEDARYQAARYFANRCLTAPFNQEACYNLAVMYYNGTVKGGREEARKIAATSCTAGYQDSCRIVSAIDTQREQAARLKAENDRKAEEFAARQQGGYSAGVSASYGSSYSTGSSSSYSSSSSSASRAQDTADFNAFINKVNSYNTGYSASCRTGNPYC
ncbi:conserved domain protein [Hyphomonas neptunium ATCC 15444]|uniref:Conserved domain protein n=2 Tax=Hyphomonas TaxID=85 RepID=Q0C4C1_HYPNA|nr:MULTISPECIES: tetratricopeptide repeat protein [Hyphomonas]ABI77722.1 conserved domain protein [Hyphomonas neptunium ATCC 15444]KCZ96365.1 hypothetical protein HHI_01760 [Hyphomonas hirschiana VP5]